MNETRKDHRLWKVFLTIFFYILAAAAGFIFTVYMPAGQGEFVQAPAKEEAGEEKEPEEAQSGPDEEGEAQTEEEKKEAAEQEAQKKAEEAAREIRREDFLALAEEDPWAAFSSLNYCMLGDSRISGFSIYGFLDQTRVFAEDGAIITMMRDYYESFEKLAPEHVFISFGINDMITGFWNTPEEYADKVCREVLALKEYDPEAVYYINSILPAIGPALREKEIWQQVPAFNEALQKMCEENGFVYIDNTELVEAQESLYARDGIHVGPDFYIHWARNMLLSPSRSGDA